MIEEEIESKSLNLCDRIMIGIIALIAVFGTITIFFMIFPISHHVVLNEDEIFFGQYFLRTNIEVLTSGEYNTGATFPGFLLYRFTDISVQKTESCGYYKERVVVARIPGKTTFSALQTATDDVVVQLGLSRHILHFQVTWKISNPHAFISHIEKTTHPNKRMTKEFEDWYYDTIRAVANGHDYQTFNDNGVKICESYDWEAAQEVSRDTYGIEIVSLVPLFFEQTFVN